MQGIKLPKIKGLSCPCDGNEDSEQSIEEMEPSLPPDSKPTKTKSERGPGQKAACSPEANRKDQDVAALQSLVARLEKKLDDVEGRLKLASLEKKLDEVEDRVDYSLGPVNP